ncbi:hypothetical protein [Streptosporangium sp. NBC_01756]|nr:hypothetical protein [Streptosporangium sp. NBC_01756]WSC86992.1 hypothetical protein OIE48_01845 [Streptosporangium sp. NBC_01756]
MGSSLGWVGVEPLDRMLFTASPDPAEGGWVPLTAHLLLFADIR